MIKQLRPFLWILPFMAFVMGYQLLRFLTHTVVVTVPPLVGLQVLDAIKTLSPDKLNVRILAEKEDPDSAEGIIISQTPSPGRKIKPHQAIFLVITRKPPKIKAPSLCGLPIADAKEKADQYRLTLQTFALESGYPKDTCIAQDKTPGEELNEKSMALYVSSGTTPLRIMPDLLGKRADEIERFFKPFGVKIEFTHHGEDKEHVCAGCAIIEQRPLPGTVIDISKGPSVQLTTA